MRTIVRSAVLLSVLAFMTAGVQAELIGHWTFDEGSGTTAFDSSGKGYDGTISGATYTTGHIGSGALQFDGTAHVSVPYNLDLTLAYTDYTMAFWVKQDFSGSQDPFQIYIGNNDMNDNVGGYAIYNATAGDALANINTATGGESLSISKPSDGEWTHYAMTYDGTTRTVYRNGVVDASMASNPIGYDSVLNDPLWFGALHGYDWYHLKGCMDDIQIYNQSLTAAEVGTVFAGNVIEPPTPNRVFDVPQIGVVTIDGNLSDWSDSTAWSEDFVEWAGTGLPGTTTKAKFAWNDASDMLYVAIQTDQALGGHAVVGVGTTVDDVPTTAVGSTQLAFDIEEDGSVSVMNEIQYYSDKYSLGWADSGTDDVLAAQTNDGTTWTYELAIPYWKNWTTMDERQSISADDEYYVYLVMEDALEGGNGTDMTVVGNPNFAGGAFDVASKLTFKSSQIAGDANNDGKVDGSDVTILAGNWQYGVDGLNQATWAMGDFNGDGKVDGSDVTILAGNWQYGVEAAAASVPEPSTLMLLAGLAFLAFWFKR